MKILQYIGFTDIINSVGGAERSFCLMANALAAKGHEVYAVCKSIHAGLPFFPLDDRVQFINVGNTGHRECKPLSWRISRPFRFIAPKMWDQHIGEPFNKKKAKKPMEPFHRLIREVQPDVVIPWSVSDYLSMYAHSMPNVPVILTTRGNAQNFIAPINTQESMVKINTCPHLHVLQRSFVPEVEKIYRGSIHVIPNTVPQLEDKDLADLRSEKPQKTITMVARLDPTKQQHLLIQAFEHLAKDYSDWKVEIYGPLNEHEGAKGRFPEYLRQLNEMIVSLGNINQVKLMGATSTPLEVLRKADIFAFPSNHPEGFPRALSEAMATGLPCVGLKSTPSVNDLIVDGVNGFLTDNTPDDFAAKLKILMDDQNLRIKMGKAGHEMMKEYAHEKVWDQWEDLITTVVQQHRQRKTA